MNIMIDYFVFLFFAFLVVLNVGDIATTCRALRIGAGKEGNGLLRWLFNKLGVLPALLITKGTILLIYFVVLLYVIIDFPITCLICSMIAVIIYSWIFLHNASVLGEFEKKQLSDILEMSIDEYHAKYTDSSRRRIE